MKDYKTTKDRLSTKDAEMLGTNVHITIFAVVAFIVWGVYALNAVVDIITLVK